MSLNNQTIEKMNEIIINCKALSREVCTIIHSSVCAFNEGFNTDAVDGKKASL